MASDPLRVGIIGCDTSHVIAFSKLINDSVAIGARAKVEVVCAFPGGSPDIPSSRDRVPGYTDQLRSTGIDILGSIEDVAERSDAILLESLDGRVHLEQFRKVARGKPVFVDKPAAASLADVIEIFRLAEATKTPCFSSSGLRFSEQVVGLKEDQPLGKLQGCEVASPFQTEPHHPDLFWYGVHGVESIYTLMSRGCETVMRTEGGHETVVTGKWSDGRLAVFRGLKTRSDYAFIAYGEKDVKFQRGFSGYEGLVNEICEFFLTGKPPVSPEETIEMFAFMEAADESLRRGQPVAVQEMIDRARSAATRNAPSAK
jgi:predicted dehydrogenase